MGELIELSQEILVAGEKSDQEWINEFRKDGIQDESMFRLRGLKFNEMVASRKHPTTARCSSLTPKEIIEQSGQQYSAYTAAGVFVTAFATIESQKGLSLRVCQATLPTRNFFLKTQKGSDVLVDHAGPEKWRLFLLDMSHAKCHFTDKDWVYGKPFTREQVRRQGNIAQGLHELLESNEVEKVSDKLISKLDVALDGVAKSKVSKVKSAVTKEVNGAMAELNRKFEDEVNHAADTIAKQRTEELREAAETQRKASIEARKKYERQSKVTAAMQNRLPMFMTKKEFKLIQGCLHSDRIPDDLKPRFDDAFVIFNRLAEGGAWDN